MTTNTDRQDAIVQLPEAGGRGVLVYGGLILTAAHCLHDIPADGTLMLERRFLVKVETTSGTLTADVAEVLLMNDIAVLRSLDYQEAAEEAEAFEEFCDANHPRSPVHARIRAAGTSLRAHLLARGIMDSRNG